MKQRVNEKLHRDTGLRPVQSQPHACKSRTLQKRTHHARAGGPCHEAAMHPRASWRAIFSRIKKSPNEPNLRRNSKRRRTLSLFESHQGPSDEFKVPECLKMSREKISAGEKRAASELKTRTHRRAQTLFSRTFERSVDTSCVSYITPVDAGDVRESGREKFVKLGKLSHLKCPPTALDESGMPCSAKAMRTACTEKTVSARGCVPARRMAGTGNRRRMSETEQKEPFCGSIGSKS